MKLETKIAGYSGKLEIAGSNFRYEREAGVIIEGAFSLGALEHGCYSVLIEGRSYRVTLGAPGEMMVNGSPVQAEIFDPRSLRGRKAGGAGQGRRYVSASMPGKIVRLLVALGDAVEAGQGLVVVEAMKMQNEIKSPQAGRVVEVRIGPDAAVVAGDVLMVVE